MNQLGKTLAIPVQAGGPECDLRWTHMKVEGENQLQKNCPDSVPHTCAAMPMPTAGGVSAWESQRENSVPEAPAAPSLNLPNYWYYLHLLEASVSE